MLSVKELIAKKRDNNELTKEEIDFFIKGVTNNEITNEQISAIAMAICINKLNPIERSNLTLAMKNSGSNIVFSNLKDKPIIDKHSTGGVGDLVSIPLGPIVAACGAYVPMITGKGLGHTGGTTDKLNSIPGYNTAPSVEQFKKVTQEVGCAIIGQTESLAPADKRIYAVRDTTGTVESIDLISSSILSKKLAAGVDYLIMDVKVGSGAFMSNYKDAQLLAQTIVEIANSLNTKTRALITDMNECLSSSLGNALEIKESIEFLLGNCQSEKLKTVIFGLAREMLLVADVVKNKEEAQKKIEYVLNSGKAAEIFEKMVCALGGPSNILSTYNSSLPQAKVVKPIYAYKEGYIKEINNRKLGATLITLGGGRKTINDILDLSVGLEQVRKIGDLVNKDIPLAIVHAKCEEDVKKVEEEFNKAIILSEIPLMNGLPIIYEIIT